MWIFDLTAATVATIIVMVFAIVVIRQHNKIAHPDPSLEEKIRYYEELNETLRKEMED